MHRVKAIRRNKKVGLGSCSSIDECLSDQEIIDQLNQEKIYTAKQAVQWALKREGLWLEQNLNARWGEDSDPQLEAWRNFHK